VARINSPVGKSLSAWSLAGSIEIDLELRNRLQGHAMTDVGSVHYDRWGYLPEKRRAMETWSTWLETTVARV
jgi:hypothetical protein